MDVASLVVKVSTDGASKAQNDLDKLAKQSSKTESATTSLAKSSNLLNVALSSIAIGTLLKESAKLADTYKLTEGRLSLVTKNTIELATAQQEILKISQNTRQSYADTIDLYTRVARSTQDLGKSQSDILKFTEIVNKSLVISGASAENSKSAIIQLGQALGSGVLQGDELRSILENAPRLAEAIAKGMGKTVGELKTLGEQGKLTAEEVFNAIQKQGEAIDKEFGKMPKTIGQATTQMGNSILELVGTMDKLTGASGFVADKISALSKIMDDFSSNARVASSSVFEQKTVDDITIKANQIASEIQKLKDKMNDDDSWKRFGGVIGETFYQLNHSDRAVSEYTSKIKRLEQQMEQLGQTAVDVLWKTSQGTKSAVLSGEQVKKQVDDALSGYKAYYQAIGDNETVLAIKRREYAEKYKNLTAQQIEAIINSERDKNNKTEELAKKWAERKREIDTELAISEQDELAKPFLKLQLEYAKDLEEFKNVVGAKELLAKNFNAEYQRLGADTTAKLEEKAQKEKQKDIQKELKLQEENFRIQARQVELLDDEADKQVALATLEYQRTQASLKAQMQLDEIIPEYYNAMMEMEDKLLEKQKQNWTLAGQVVNNVTSKMESSMTDFLDATSDNFADFGKMATSILQEVYREIIRISVVKPLVSSITSGVMGAFGGGVTANATGGVYNSPSLSAYSNQVVDKPTFFAFASGGVPNSNVGVFGEAGSEAIMPLTRTSNGDLGVKAEGIGLEQVKIQIINESGTQMEVTKTSQTTDMEGLVIQAWISGISKNRYGSRDMLGGGR